MAIGGRVIPVLQAISRSIPIVVPSAPDPVGLGWVQSLARPGGQITGLTFLEQSLFGKMLEILREIAPARRRVVMPYNPDNPSTVVLRRWFEASARELGIEPIASPVHRLADIERAITNLENPETVGVFVPSDVTLNAMRDQIVVLLGRLGLPAIYPLAAFVRAGGLAFYGADRIDLWRQSADYVDRVLRGENPAELPFQQPTKYVAIDDLVAVEELLIASDLLAEHNRDERPRSRKRSDG